MPDQGGNEIICRTEELPSLIPTWRGETDELSGLNVLFRRLWSIFVMDPFLLESSKCPKPGADRPQGEPTQPQFLPARFTSSSKR